MTVKTDSNELHFKILYAGPSSSGKSMNLLKIHQRFGADSIYSSLTQEKTLDGEAFRYEYTSFTVGSVRGIKPVFHIYSIPAGVSEHVVRDYFLSGVDGIVFVVDSQPYRLEENSQSFLELKKLLDDGEASHTIPIVLQCNKQDESLALPTDILQRSIASKEIPCFSANAAQSVGVFETLKHIIKMLIKQIVPSELGLEVLEMNHSVN